jgi:hypothetical protein
MTNEEVIYTKAEIVALFEDIEYKNAFTEIIAEYLQMVVDDKEAMSRQCPQPENEKEARSV